jgi:hypothetical protein
MMTKNCEAQRAQSAEVSVDPVYIVYNNKNVVVDSLRKIKNKKKKYTNEYYHLINRIYNRQSCCQAINNQLNGNNGEYTNGDDFIAFVENEISSYEVEDRVINHPWVTYLSMHLLDDNSVVMVIMDVFRVAVPFRYRWENTEDLDSESVIEAFNNFPVYEEISNHFMVYAPPTVQQIMQFRARSQLNGINGEATNSDDVEFTAADRVALNKRNHKESITSGYKKNPGATNKGNSEARKILKFGFWNVKSERMKQVEINSKHLHVHKANRTNESESSSDEFSSNSSDDNSSEESNSETTTVSDIISNNGKSNKTISDNSVYYCIRQDDDLHLYYDGVEYYSEPFGPYYVGPNRGKCENCGPGFIVINENPKKNNKNIKITPCMERVMIEGYYRRDQFGKHLFYGTEYYNVVNILLSMMQKQLTSSRIDESLTNACIALANRSGIPGQYQESTTSYYLATIHRKESRIKGATGLMERYTNNGGVIGEGDFGRIENSVKIGVDVNIYAPLYELDAECDLPDYPIRDDWELLSDPLNVVGADRRPRFRTYRNMPKHQGLTKFFSLRGKNQDTFVEYNESANNLNHGLKRVLGRRDDEQNYRQNAMKLGQAIYRKKSHMRYNPKLRRVYLKLLGNRVINNNPEDKLGEDCLTRDFIAEKILSIVGLCHRSRISRVLDTLYTTSSWSYYKVYEEILTVFHPLLSRETNANMIHIKRNLRRQYVNGRRLHTDDDIMVQNAKTSIKRELAKPGKAPRLFVNYDAGSMYAGELPEFVKMCVDGLHIFNNNGKTLALYIMAKPKSDTLEKLFNMLKDALSTDNFCQSIIYSDDSCVSGLKDGHSFGYNVDISSNDSSQDLPAFLVSYLAMRRFHEDRAEGLIDQSLLPIIIGNDENPSEKIKIKFNGPFEGSGNLLTTVLNHFGSAMIHLGAFFRWSRGVEEMKDAIVSSARVVGHVVTIEKWGFDGNNFDKCQFIKRSPAYDGGIYPAINMGVILRSFGSVWDELSNQKLPEKTHLEFVSMTLDERMQLYFSKIIQGWQHENKNSLFYSLRKRFNSSVTEVIKHDSLIYVLDDYNSKDYATREGDNHLMSRYGLSRAEIEEACILIENIQLGMHVSCDAFSKIFHVDYGMALPDGLSVN